VPPLLVEKNKHNPKYRPYGKDSLLSAASAMPLNSLMRWPVSLLGVGLILIILLVLPTPGGWVDRLLNYEFIEGIDIVPGGE
jgi:hypothetical protein